MGCDSCKAACPSRTRARRSGRTAEGGQGRKAAVTFALLGQPNSGKSTVFNGLTGARQHVGNWPGKTVEVKDGSFTAEGRNYEVIDLPGSYSITAQSPEEEVTRDYLATGEADAVVVLADASQLERSLYMLADFAPNSTPCVLALNLMDVARRQGKTVNADLLERRLGIPVVPMVASKREGLEALVQAVDRACAQGLTVAEPPMLPAAAELSGADRIQVQAAARYRWIEDAVDGVVDKPAVSPALSRLDRIAVGSRFSTVLAFAMILAGFLLSFIPAAPIMLAGSGIAWLGQEVSAALLAAGAPDIAASFLAGVVFNSLSFGVMMVGYVFGINLVFGFYEDTGYLARISYVFDRTMAKFGLQGKSVMPFIMCFGCTIGGVSGARVIDSWGQRMLTVAMAWAIPCGTTWGVVPVLAVAFFGWGAPLVVVGLFLTAVVLMAVIGRLFGPKLVSKDERAGMVMELPPYHKPHIGAVLRGSCLKSWQMFKRAIRVVALFALAVWALTYTSTGSVEGSLLYVIGTAIEPATMFFGLTWETFTAWLCALVVKESALGVLSGLFAGTGTPGAAVAGAVTASAAVAANLGDIMASAITAPQALAFIFAFTFNVPCAASVSATFGEVHSVKWTVLTGLFYLAASLLLGCAVYHVSSLFL